MTNLNRWDIVLFEYGMISLLFLIFVFFVFNGWRWIYDNNTIWCVSPIPLYIVTLFMIYTSYLYFRYAINLWISILKYGENER